jgi:hypothetical protein
MSQSKIALIALIVFAAWLFIALPMIYLPDGIEFPKEPLGMKAGEWLLSFATFGLWYATWRLVKGADKTAERQLRAYVGAFEMSLSASASTFSSVIKTKNFGSTPASNFRTSIRLGWQPAPVASIPISEPNWLSAGVTLMPGEETTTICELFVGPALSQIYSDVVAGKLAIYLSGYIDYRDAFGCDRRTTIRRIATGSRALSTSPFVHAPEGDNVV